MSASSSKLSPSTFFLPFDPNSPLLVAKGVLTTGTLGAITGASIGVFQSKNPFALSINMTINLSIAGLTFSVSNKIHCIREYIVSPLLLSIEITPSHTKRLKALKLENLSDVQIGKLPESDLENLSEVRWNRLLDSSIAGGLTGGILSAAFRGKATFLKAGITSSLITSIIQLSINQIRIIRLKTLAKQSIQLENKDKDKNSIIFSKSHKEYNSSFNESQSQIIKSFEDNLRPSDEEITKSNIEKPSFPEKMMNSLTKFLPVRKLTNEEYIQTLEKKKDDINKRLKEIDEEEKRMYDWAQSQSGSPS